MSDDMEEAAFEIAEREIDLHFQSYYSRSSNPIYWKLKGHFEYDPCRMHTLITRKFKQYQETVQWWMFCPATENPSAKISCFFIDTNLTDRVKFRMKRDCRVASDSWFDLCDRCEMRERYDPCEYCPRCIKEQTLILSNISEAVPQETLSKDVLSIIKKYV
jgi:hypothetical protein